MKAKALLSLIAGAALTLHATAASGQYAPGSEGFRSPEQARAEQGADGAPAGLGLAFVTY